MSTEQKDGITIPQIFTVSTGIIVTAFAVGLYSRFNQPLTPYRAAAERVLKQYDTNGDGSLDREELTMLSTSLQLEDYDTNKNGRLNEQELSNLLKDHKLK